MIQQAPVIVKKSENRGILRTPQSKEKGTLLLQGAFYS